MGDSHDEVHISFHGRSRENISAAICPFICKGYESLFKHKERAMAMFFLVLEMTSIGLSLLGKTSAWHCDLAVFLLSLCMAAIILYNYIKQKCLSTTLQEGDIDIRVISDLEVVFAVFQLIISLVYMILAVRRINSNNHKFEQLLPILFNGYVVYYLFAKNEEANNDELSLQAIVVSSPRNHSQLLMENLQPISDPFVPSYCDEFDSLIRPNHISKDNPNRIGEQEVLEYASVNVSLSNSLPLDKITLGNIKLQPAVSGYHHKSAWSSPL